MASQRFFVVFFMLLCLPAALGLQCYQRGLKTSKIKVSSTAGGAVCVACTRTTYGEDVMTACAGSLDECAHPVRCCTEDLCNAAPSVPRTAAGLVALTVLVAFCGVRR